MIILFGTIIEGSVFMKTGIIGFGNLGRALCEGLIRSGTAAPADIFVCDANADARAFAVGNFGASAFESVSEVVMKSELVFLTVKSYVFEALAPEIKGCDLSEKTFVSFMAGVRFDAIYSLIGTVKLVRAMPSLAISSCDGVIGYTACEPAVSEIFHKLGYAFETAPESIEKVMAFSSCGLGFAAYLISAFSKAGEGMGFPAEVCDMIAARTFKNAIDRGGFTETVAAVATKGGATEQGVLHMEEKNVFGILEDAVNKAYLKMQ